VGARRDLSWGDFSLLRGDARISWDGVRGAGRLGRGPIQSRLTFKLGPTSIAPTRALFASSWTCLGGEFDPVSAIAAGGGVELGLT
jgi:hypothetical protein